MDDITPATRRMTYAELGAARSISPKSAERLAQRRRWARQVGNDGMARVVVPIGEDRVTPRRQGVTSTPDVATRRGCRPSPDIGDVVGVAIRDIVAPLSAQLEHERARADKAEQEAAKLWVELIELRVSERMAERAAAEAAELRRRLDAEAEERRQTADRLTAAQERITAMLTDQRAAVPDSVLRPSPWWRRRFGRGR